MTDIENSYTMPLLFDVCWKQGYCCLSAIGVLAVPGTAVMQSSDWGSPWYGTTQDGRN